jgi:hypothetical protein
VEILRIRTTLLEPEGTGLLPTYAGIPTRQGIDIRRYSKQLFKLGFRQILFLPLTLKN